MTRTVSGHRGTASSSSTLADIVAAYCQHYPPSAPHIRQMRLPSGVFFPWIMVSYEGLRIPEQGWKLHIAASEAGAELVLRRVLPILLLQTATFKVMESQDSLARLNEGLAGLSQIGKFITVYPRDDAEAVRLADDLDDATQGLTAPAIPSDRPLRPGSLVSYRYGGFQSPVVQTDWGDHQMMIRTPDQTLVADQRNTVYTPPAWAIDPFLAAGSATEIGSPPLFIADRYLLLTTLHQSAQSQIQLAADLTGARRCIVKRPGLSFMRGGETADAIACIRLREEAQALQALTPHPGFPALYDVVEEGGEIFLVMEDMEGETLEAFIRRLKTRGLKLSIAQMIAWTRELLALLATIHARGFLHRDLKSSNVIVAPNNHLRLLDFGLAQRIDKPDRWPGAGTPGYMSPQQLNGEPASVSNDIYAIGALLYFMGTGAEPSIAPRGRPLTTRPLALLNAGLPPSWHALIERCLAAESTERFASVSELEEAFDALQAQGGKIEPGVDQAETRAFSWQEASPRYRQLACRLGETLSQVARPDSSRRGLCWTSSHYVGKGMRALDLNMGNSGSLLALAEMVDEFGDARHCQVVAEGARWLMGASRVSAKPLPGLYIGESGTGTALLRAGQVLDDPRLILAAEERSRLVAAQPFLSPDLFNGTAGRIRFHLWLWDVTADAEQLSLATRAGDALIASAQEVSPQQVCWQIPTGYGGMSGQIYLGYAHGAAGIADALLDLYEATQQERFLRTALHAGYWLQRQAMPVLDDESGLDWPVTEGAQPHGAYWCHGATGIGGFFLHLARVQALPEALAIAERAARTVAHGNRACGPVQCHGLAGNIEFLLDMAQSTGNQQYTAWAFELARVLETFALETDGLLVWSSESPITITPDYQVGYAGIAMTLLRLGNPQRPRQLGRSGLLYRSPRVKASTSAQG